MKRNKTKRNDWLVMGSILAIAIVFAIFFKCRQDEKMESGMVVITVDRVVYGRYPLEEEKEERIECLNGAYNVLQIRNGEVTMTEASCPDQYCVKHPNISKNMESIVCLPNKVIVSIENDKNTEVDFSVK